MSQTRASDLTACVLELTLSAISNGLMMVMSPRRVLIFPPRAMAKSHHINESESSRLRANQASFLDTISRTVVSGIRNGDYVVADLEDFKRNAERASIHQVKKIYSSPKEQWTFPMLAVYDKQTRSVCIDDPAMQTSAPKESERLDASDMLDMEDIVEILALDEQHWMTEDDIRAAREAELRAESSHGGGVDYWEHDLKSHRWTYHVVVPRKAMVRPSKTPGSIGEPPDPWKLSPVRVSHVQHKDKTPVTIYEDSYAFGKTRQLWTGRVEFFDGGHAPSKTTVSSYHGSDVLGGDSGLPYRQSVPRDERPYRGTKKPNSIDSASWRSMNRAEREGYVEAERREAEAKAMSREDTRDAAPADVEFDSAYDSPAEKHQKDYWLELVHRQGEVLSEFVQEKLAIAGEKFHDVVHEIVSNKVVFQGVRVAVFLGTPVGLITWIILAYFSSVFLREVTRSTRRRRKTRGERKVQATSRKQCKSLLLAAL